MSSGVVPAARPLEKQPKAIVVGASSGIGAALALELARQGVWVAALARREAALAALSAQAEELTGEKRILPYVHDVTDFEAIPALFQTITRELDGLDLIVYVAGIQPSVGPDEYDFAKDQAMMQVNVLGAMAWLNLAAARFTRTGRGHIVGISSISGDRGRRGFPGYHTSKSALNTYLESLRNRLTQHGVHVTTIKPGFVQTALLENAGNTFWVITPEQAATQIRQAVEKKKQTVYVPGRWRWVLLIIQHIPSFIFRRMNF